MDGIQVGFSAVAHGTWSMPAAVATDEDDDEAPSPGDDPEE